MKLDAHYYLAPRAHAAAQTLIDEYLGNLSHREVIALEASRAKVEANSEGEIRINGRVIGRIEVVETKTLNGGDDDPFWSRKIAALPEEVDELKARAQEILERQIHQLQKLLVEFK